MLQFGFSTGFGYPKNLDSLTSKSSTIDSQNHTIATNYLNHLQQTIWTLNVDVASQKSNVAIETQNFGFLTHNFDILTSTFVILNFKLILEKFGVSKPRFNLLDIKFGPFQFGFQTHNSDIKKKINILASTFVILNLKLKCIFVKSWEFQTKI